MALRAKKPAAVPSRLKTLFYGAAGIGKSTAAIQFPKPYWIDTEGSADKPQYVKIMEKQGGAVFQTQDFDDMIREVRSLLSEKHEYKTLIIDSLTIVYHDLLDKAAKDRINEKDPDGTAFGGHYGVANKKMKTLLNLLLRLDMNVIITSHAKNEYGTNLAVLGQTYDCYKKLDYLFDLVFEIQKRGKERVALVKKTRFEEFQESDVFPFSYDEIATRYGRDILEKEAEVQELATPEQLTQVNRLLALLKVPEETIEKWLKKGNSESWEEMPRKGMQAIIDHLLNSINEQTTQGAV